MSLVIQPQVRPVLESDLAQWLPLWKGYNAFYGREGRTALPEEVTAVTWERFFNPNEPMFAFVAALDGKLVGLTHYLYHRSTTRIEATCYLQDLFTAEAERGRGIGKLLIEAVYEAARAAGVKRIYWQTHEMNATGRRLYDKVAIHTGFIVYGTEW